MNCLVMERIIDKVVWVNTAIHHDEHELITYHH